GAVHDRLVGPFKIKGANKGLAQAPVLELLKPAVEKPTRGARRRIVGDDILLHTPIANRRKVVPRSPGAGRELLAKQVIFRGKAFEGHLAIPVILIADQIEIVLTARNRQIGAPPIFHPFVFDVAAWLETSDLVRAATQWRLEGALVEWMSGVIGSRKNRKPGNKQRDITCSVFRESHDHRCIVQRIRSGKIAQELLRDRMALLLERLQ